MKRLLLTAFLCAALSAAAAAQSSPQPAGGADSRAELRRQTFDMVWRTVKDKHFDPTFGGVDWDKVREQYEPRAAAVKSDTELYDLMQKMIGELHQSHFRIIPPESVPKFESAEPERGGVGLDLRLLDGQAVITRVDAGSKAAAAGLRPGFVIKQVNAKTVDQILAEYADSKDSPVLTRLKMRAEVLGRINGKPETSVRILYLDETYKPREATVERERLKGEMSPPLGNFPSQYTEFESRTLQSGIGYIRFNIFITLVMPKVREAIRAFAGAPGIIIDLRGNPGGIGGMASGIAGLLETEQTSLGAMNMRASKMNFTVFPQASPYRGKVVILIDGGSASTSEIFAAGMQELGRAVIVGERSVGAALPSVFMKLPTGALFQYAIADFKTPRGTLIEGRGVVPDREVKLTRAGLLAGHDSQLEAAIEQIEKK